MESYLTSTNLQTVPSLTTDIVIIGSGVAGLSAALAAAKSSQVLLITKNEFSDCATFQAQGGIAAALEEASYEAHLEDTLRAGAGLCNQEMVRILVSEGVERVRELVKAKVPFDRQDGGLAFTIEGGHSARRVLHAEGDATGQTLHRSLLQMAKDDENINLLEHHFAIDLLHSRQAVFGIICLDTKYNRLLRINCGAVIMASGGLGQVYQETTNPEVATGDGYAICLRAGAVLEDMEFIQFHPTTLYLAGAPRFLISEAVRGEGAYLLTTEGKRFMPSFHELAELAPRDIVSKAIIRTMEATSTNYVLLDLRHLSADLVEERFPNIRAFCSDYGIDITHDAIPVRPACHYMMGGVKTDSLGRTNVENLYACGEVACSEVHGANRLASNSLLEGLVFGHRAGEHARENISRNSTSINAAIKFTTRTEPSQQIKRNLPLDIDDVLHSLRSLAWRELGIFRTGEQLIHAENTINFWSRYVLREVFTAASGFEAQNIMTVAKMISRAALLRTESRGAHQRLDYPETDDDHWQKHIQLSRENF
ncbi:MAG: L-aspartate oxidase [Planctomycetes bacterium]|nr:L-aspartate oxidase [Planctomycetota bacterium]